ncbi:MAG TPA: wax ester/triacylglycerol synthase family O-acyltransferase [Iamia sp.]|nr:wax ester/triacylglycerol synthase family O-acyltransferase [Iamia sp.]
MERLTGLDATFLYLETPTHHMHVAMTMVLDPSTMPGGYSFQAIKDFIASRTDRIPPFRRRLVSVPLNLHHPVWVEDPEFDIDYHIRRMGAPAPGGRRELGEMAAQIASVPLDRSRPLWEMWVIEGLKQDRIAVVSKVHHCAIDGASGSELMVHLFDLDPADAVVTGPPPELPSERVPTDAELIGHAITSKVRRTMGLGPLLNETARSVSRVVKARRDPEGLVGAAPLTAPRVPWNGPTSGRRDVGFARVPLATVKDLKTALGCTVNDVVLALCAGTLRRYLEQHDALPDEPLVAVCPVSVRTEDDTAGSNKVSALFTSLATQLDDPIERLEAIRTTTRGAKEEHNAVGATMLQDWAEFAGPNVFNLASRLYSSMNLANVHRPVHNLIVSNVPGPPFPLYFAGAEAVAAYPMGPVMEGCGLNVTVFSYQESVDIGFMVDKELVPDVWTMADAVEPALAELVAAAGTGPKRAKRSTTKQKAS